MKELPLLGGQRALVDDDVYEWAKDFRWCADHYGYACCYIGNGQQWHLHRQILPNPPPGYIRDHVNGNRLDNRRENLRYASRKLNNLNSKVRKGYYLHAGKWRVRFKVGDIYIDASGLKTEEEAKGIAALLRGSLIYYELTKGGQNR